MKKWKNVPIPEYREQYLVSNEGEVYSIKTQRCLVPIITKAGYLRVHLAHKGNVKTVAIHRLVALAFIDNPCNKPTVNHINEIKSDNRVENLEWATNREQNIHGTRIQRAMDNTDWALRTQKMNYKAIASKHDYQKQTMCNRKMICVFKGDNKIGVFTSQREAAKFIGISAGRLSECLKGSRKPCKGYTFKRLED